MTNLKLTSISASLSKLGNLHIVTTTTTKTKERNNKRKEQKTTHTYTNIRTEKEVGDVETD